MEKNKDIISFIKNNLNHDFNHDFDYLMKEIIHYQSLRGAEEIVPEIINLIKTELGAEGMKKFQETLKNSFNERISKYQEALNLIKNNDKEKAQEILVKLIDTFPAKKKTDDDIPLYNFQNVFESIIFNNLHKELTKIRQINEPITGYYFHLSVMFYETKDYEECLKLLENVLAYNPLFVEGLLLKAECYLHLGYTNLFFDNVNLALRYSYKRMHLAKCYFSLGKYYNDLNNKQLAMSLTMVSKHYEVTPFVDVLIKQIATKPGELAKFDNPADLSAVFHDNNIQLGPSKLVFEVLNGCIKDARNRKNKEMLKYFLTLAANLTKEEVYSKELNQLNEG